jgi:hypothetical protein
MNDTSTETAGQAEHRRLMNMAEAGQLTPTTWQRLIELNEQQAAAGQPQGTG